MNHVQPQPAGSFHEKCECNAKDARERCEPAAVEFKNVTVSIGGNLILDNVSASVPKGGSTAIIGPNGAGKTTLLLCLLGQIPYSGNIRVVNTKDGLRPRIGYVPQRLQFDRGMPLTTLEFMAMGHQRTPLCFGVSAKNRSRAIELLEFVKAEKLEKRRLGALSNGEMQRVLLALAIGQEPELLVLDEPASGVDFQGEHVFCELLENLREKHGFTQLMVSHDLATVTHHATYVICLNQKVAAEGPPQEVLATKNLTAIFGLHMGLVDESSLPDSKAALPSSRSKEENTGHA